jgi:phosphatidylglycerophosphate synthase
LASFLLDIYDGKLARAYKQCTFFGDGVDWSCDLYIDVLFMVWWGRLEASIFPFILFWTMAEIMAAVFDFAIHAADRYPRRGKQSGFCIILEWGMPGGGWSTFGWIIWLSYPFFVCARCLSLGYAEFFASLPFVTEFFTAVQAVLLIPAMCFVWSNFALLFASIGRWKERNQNLEKKV